MKSRIKSMNWNIRKQKNNQAEQEEKRIQNNEDSISSLWDNCKRVPVGEETEQEIGNLFEKIMKENFPNLVKKIDMLVRKHRESQRLCNEAHSKTHHS